MSANLKKQRRSVHRKTNPCTYRITSIHSIAPKIVSIPFAQIARKAIPDFDSEQKIINCIKHIYEDCSDLFKNWQPESKDGIELFIELRNILVEHYQPQGTMIEIKAHSDLYYLYGTKTFQPEVICNIGIIDIIHKYNLKRHQLNCFFAALILLDLQGISNPLSQTNPEIGWFIDCTRSMLDDCEKEQKEYFKRLLEYYEKGEFATYWNEYRAIDRFSKSDILIGFNTFKKYFRKNHPMRLWFEMAKEAIDNNYHFTGNGEQENEQEDYLTLDRALQFIWTTDEETPLYGIAEQLIDEANNIGVQELYFTETLSNENPEISLPYPVIFLNNLMNYEFRTKIA